MKKLILICFVFFLFKVSITAETKLEKIYEREFDIDGEIEDVVFGKAKLKVSQAEKIGMLGLDGKSPDEKVEVNYPKVLKTKNKVIWYNPDGTKINELSLEKFGEVHQYYSSNCFNKVHFLKSENIIIENRIGEFEFNLFLLDADGDLLWFKKGIGDMPFTSENGQYILTGRWPGLLEGTYNCVLYDINGTEIFRKKMDIGFMGDWKAYVLNSGNLIIIETVNSTATKIYLVNTQKNITLWMKTYPASLINTDAYIYSTKLSSANRIVAYSEDSSFLVGFDEISGELWQDKEELVKRPIEISPDGQEMLYSVRKKEGYLSARDINSGKVLYKISLKDYPGINQIDFSPQGEWLLLQSRIDSSKYRNNIFLLNRKDKIITPINDDYWSAATFVEENIIAIKGKNQVRLFKIEIK